MQTGAVLPLVVPKDIDIDKINLGKSLFENKIFSKDNSLSCASCHSLHKWGCDNLSTYSGLHNKKGQLNTPTVLNASLNFRQFWDGRAKTMDNVIDDHLTSENIFGNNWINVVERISQHSTYAVQFSQIYTNALDAYVIKDALINYLNSLFTPLSPFDNFLNGDKTALSEDAKKGYELFQQYGCMTCHEGQNLGGNLFQPLGIYQNYFQDKPHLTEADLGRFNVTKKEQDKFVFKVPSLRNIAKTAPYLHDGSIKTLTEMVKIMGIYQVGQEIPVFEVDLIVKFLESLTGEIAENNQNIQKTIEQDS